MKQPYSLFAVAVLFSVAVGSFAVPQAYAATPTLSLSVTSGDNVQVSVNGDPNMSIVLYYNIGSASGQRVTTLGTTNGSGTFSTIMSTSAYSISAGTTAYVVVNNQTSAVASWPATSSSGGTSALTFSPQNLSVSAGGNQITTIYGGDGIYTISSNTNPSAASLNLSGSSLTVNGLATGNASITVCDIATSCGTLYVTVGGSSTGGSSTSGNLSFIPSNPSLAVGQIVTVNISGGSGYFVTGSSNPSVASWNLSGSGITISGLVNGTASITVCSSANGCSPLTVTVGASNTSQAVTFSTTNPTLTVGQTLSVALAGGSSYFISSNPIPNIVQSSVNGSSLSLYGQSSGSGSLTVCATAGGCGTLYVTVTSQPTVVQSSSGDALLATIQSVQSQLAQILTQIQTMANTLTQLASSITPSTPSAQTSAGSGTASSYIFTELLNLGSQGAEVTALQGRLSALGLYSGPITGYFGPLTGTAVKKYQTAHGLDPKGYVGPETRAVLNSGK